MHEHGKISSNISESEMSIFPKIFFFLSTTKAMNELWLYTDIVSYIYLSTDIEFFFYTTKPMNELWLYTDMVSYIYLNTDIEFV